MHHLNSLHVPTPSRHGQVLPLPPPLPLSTPTRSGSAAALCLIPSPGGNFSTSSSRSAFVLPSPLDFFKHTAVSDSMHMKTEPIGHGGDSPSSSLASSPTNMELGTCATTPGSSSAVRTNSFSFNASSTSHSSSSEPMSTAPTLTPDFDSTFPASSPADFELRNAPVASSSLESFGTNIRPIAPEAFGSGFIQPDADLHRHHTRRRSRRLSHLGSPLARVDDSPFGTHDHDHIFDHVTVELHPHSPLGGDSRRVSLTDVHAHLQIPDFPAFDFSRSVDSPLNKNRRSSLANVSSNLADSESYSHHESKAGGTTSYAASGAMDTSSDDHTSTSRRISGGRHLTRTTPNSSSRHTSSRTQHLNGSGTSHVGHTTPQTLNNGRGPTGSSTSSHSQSNVHPPPRSTSRYGDTTTSHSHPQPNGIPRRDASKVTPPPPSTHDSSSGTSRSLSPVNRGGKGIGTRTVIGSTTPAVPGMVARAQSMGGISNLPKASVGVTTRGQSSVSQTNNTSVAQLPAEDTKRTPASNKKQKNRTRKRAAVACVSCHNAKTGCEGGIPCLRCVRLKKDHTCERFEHRKKGRPKKGRFEMMGYPPHLLGPDGQPLYNPALHPSLAAAAMAQAHPAAYLAARAGLSNSMTHMYFAQAQAAHAAQAHGMMSGANPYAQYASMAAVGMPGAMGGMPSAAAQLSELRNSMNPSPNPLMGTDPSMAAGILAPNGVTPLTPTGRGTPPPPASEDHSAKFHLVGSVDSNSRRGSGSVYVPSPSVLSIEERRERFRDVFMVCSEKQLTKQKISYILESDMFHEAVRFYLSFVSLVLSQGEYQAHESRLQRMCNELGISRRQISFPVQLYKFACDVDSSASNASDALPACISSLRFDKPDNSGTIRVNVSANKTMLNALQMSLHDVKNQCAQLGVPWHFALMHENDWEHQVSLFLDAIQRLRFSSTMRVHYTSKSTNTVHPSLCAVTYSMVPPGVIGTITTCGITYPQDMVMQSSAASSASSTSAPSRAPSVSSSVSRSASPMPLPGVVGMVNSAPAKYTPMGLPSGVGGALGTGASYMNGLPPMPRGMAASSMSMDGSKMAHASGR